MAKKKTELVPAGSSNLLEVAAQFGVTSEDLGELARIGADSMSRAMFEVSRAGMAFLRAQELLSLGNFGNGSAVSDRSDTDGFIEWINGHGLAKQRVYESMRIAKFVTQLPQEHRNDVLALGKVKVMLLASLPQEVIDRAAESGNGLIERADMMTVSEFKEEIATLKKREKNYEAEIERAQLKIEKLSANKQRLTKFEPHTEEIRQECMALQLEAGLPISSLQKLFEAALNENAAEQTPESRLRLEHVWVTANIVTASALDMLSKLHDMASASPDGNDLPQRALGTHILSPAEAQEWLLSKGTIENKHEAQKAVRQEKRDADKPVAPGRPKGAKNKAKE